MKKVKKICSTAAAACLLLASGAPLQAQTLSKRKPGLWEITQTQQGAQVDGEQMPSSEEIAQMMAQMPAAQRQQMEKMMRERGGGLSASRPNTIRYCLTPEMAARDTFAQPPDPGMKCKHDVKAVSSSEARFTFTCSGPNGSFKGEGRSTGMSPEGYKTSISMQGTMEGTPMSMRTEQTGRWLGSDCQGLKPPPQ